MTRTLNETGELLLDLTRRLTSTLDLQEVLDLSLASLRSLIRFEGGSIQMVRDDALMIVAADPAPPPEVFHMRLPVGSGLGGRVVETGVAVYSGDVTDDPRVSQTLPATAVSGGVRSYFGAPLIAHGEVVGLVQIDSSDRDAFADDDRALVIAFVPTISAAVQNATLHAREQQTIEELREAERLKSDFMARVSHELRTPLTSIVGFGELLQRSLLEPDDVLDAGRRIAASGRRLQRLIEDLLSLSRIERGELSVSPVAIDLVAIVYDAAVLQMGSGPDAHRIVIRFDPGLPPVVTDPERLGQVLWVLLDNARKFSSLGTQIQIVASREQSREQDDNEEMVALSVIDQGRGINPSMLERIFQPFFQIEPASTRTAGGMGIGLYLARQLCRAMGGELTVRSDPSGGSSFTVRLRALADQAPAREMELSQIAEG